jgi:hypothetical protein
MSAHQRRDGRYGYTAREHEGHDQGDHPGDTNTINFRWTGWRRHARFGGTLSPAAELRYGDFGGAAR